MKRRGETDAAVVIVVFVVIVACLGLIGGGCWAYPQYNVWQQGLQGKAELSKAEWNRQIATKEAEAKKQAATMLAEAEVIRAEGVAKANKIIGSSLNGNESYLHYLWIQELAAAGHVIYVPTEANLPIMEASRLSAGNPTNRVNKE